MPPERGPAPRRGSRWPSAGNCDPPGAPSVDPAILPRRPLLEWQRERDHWGLRATGTCPQRYDAELLSHERLQYPASLLRSIAPPRALARGRGSLHDDGRPRPTASTCRTPADSPCRRGRPHSSRSTVKCRWPAGSLRGKIALFSLPRFANVGSLRAYAASGPPPTKLRPPGIPSRRTMPAPGFRSHADRDARHAGVEPRLRVRVRTRPAPRRGARLVLPGTRDILVPGLFRFDRATPAPPLRSNAPAGAPTPGSGGLLARVKPGANRNLSG